MSVRKHKIIDGKEYCNCVDCKPTDRRYDPPDNYFMGHPVYGSNCFSHELMDTVTIDVPKNHPINKNMRDDSFVHVDHRTPPTQTTNDYHRNINPKYDRDRNINSPLKNFFEAACNPPKPKFFSNPHDHELDSLLYSMDISSSIKPENLEKIELLLKIAKQLRVTRREIYLYIRGVRQ